MMLLRQARDSHLAVESPTKKWPSVFANIPIFVKYPYLLPTAVAASVMFTGNVLCHYAVVTAI